MKPRAIGGANASGSERAKSLVLTRFTQRIGKPKHNWMVQKRGGAAGNGRVGERGFEELSSVNEGTRLIQAEVGTC